MGLILHSLCLQDYDFCDLLHRTHETYSFRACCSVYVFYEYLNKILIHFLFNPLTKYIYVYTYIYCIDYCQTRRQCCYTWLLSHYFFFFLLYTINCLAFCCCIYSNYFSFFMFYCFLYFATKGLNSNSLRKPNECSCFCVFAIIFYVSH